MNSLAIILTCVCIHLLIIEIELLFGFITIVKTLAEYKVESEVEK